MGTIVYGISVSLDGFVRACSLKNEWSSSSTDTQSSERLVVSNVWRHVTPPRSLHSLATPSRTSRSRTLRAHGHVWVR